MGNSKESGAYLAHVAESYSQDTGGGFLCDVFLLNDGTVLVVGEDSVVLYKDVDAWENSPGSQEGFIIRPQIREP